MSCCLRFLFSMFSIFFSRLCLLWLAKSSFLLVKSRCSTLFLLVKSWFVTILLVKSQWFQYYLMLKFQLFTTFSLWKSNLFHYSCWWNPNVRQWNPYFLPTSAAAPTCGSSTRPKAQTLAATAAIRRPPGTKITSTFSGRASSNAWLPKVEEKLRKIHGFFHLGPCNNPRKIYVILMVNMGWSWKSMVEAHLVHYLRGPLEKNYSYGTIARG